MSTSGEDPPRHYRELDNKWGDTNEAVYSSTLLVELVKQLRVGVDLTKMAIPASFFSPRSILEMFTDMFSHQRLFLLPSILTDPTERFLGVCRWWFSQLYNGGGVKKSYNPILGEVFRCAFHEPEFGTTLMLAEQVCHHPPVSAIHARNTKAGVFFTGSTCARPSFNGTSIGAVPEGNSVYHLERWDEDYHITYPSAFVRGIVIGPLRFEFATQSHAQFVTCPQTGLYMNVYFVPKGYFSGEWDTIQGIIGREGEGPLFTLTGKWNGTIKATSSETGQVSTFITMDAADRVAKRRPPWAELEPHESNRVWADVSTAIHAGNTEAANQAKQVVEQAQRAVRKAEKDEGTEWRYRVFTKLENDPLPWRIVDEKFATLFDWTSLPVSSLGSPIGRPGTPSAQSTQSHSPSQSSSSQAQSPSQSTEQADNEGFADATSDNEDVPPEAAAPASTSSATATKGMVDADLLDLS